ncbi:very short patch repair endonuclease [Salinibacter ruber]|uniref:very short patch repair endonuclease n=1 Tax=Salinibacter ruber TaxID=146919 RepID=UPI003C6E7A7E
MDSSKSDNRHDIFSEEKRSHVMSKVGSKDTEPEMKVRSALHRAGFRFRLHVEDLPGTPDLVFPKYDTVIRVHGCFWHRHDCKKGRQVPKTRREFWREKLERNEERDRENQEDLEARGWTVLTAWECELEKCPESTIETLIERLTNE